MKNKIIWLHRILLGLLFILSAVSKLLPIEAFDLTLVNQGITNWTIAPYLSRLIISIELFLGISFFVNSLVKKISIPFSFLLLIVFCIHLTYLIAVGSGGKNCGCFGELIPMSSVEALIKNIVLIFLITWLNKKLTLTEKPNYSLSFGLFSLVFAGLFLIFQVKPYNITPSEEINQESIDLRNPEENTEQKETPNENELINPQPKSLPKEEVQRVKSIFSSFKDFSGGETVNLDSGIKLICLFSLDCEDCMETAYKLGQAKKDWKNFPPLYILFLGEEEQVNNFFDAAAITFPYKIIPPQTFFPLIKNYPPRIVLLNNGKIVGDWGYENFSVEDLKGKIE